MGLSQRFSTSEVIGPDAAVASGPAAVNESVAADDVRDHGDGGGPRIESPRDFAADDVEFVDGGVDSAAPRAHVDLRAFLRQNRRVVILTAFAVGVFVGSLARS